ncbi:hypothetical protein L202_00870 [Cryptococcus amylolentus CBS 6039]|uniref:Uncharacterized protein n=1 Tax=Cryptococcus amylolentus CBS 6039 TaxID=1295533 RepID=A0A1E3I8U2_9TREE|nr:hypothetical protein L202_00870 [Cryptococcus amylolentus CBS 6039]ODN85040.1 hypothetical protein L202_00870 [Cryptococcus amylolentus CBS 6039]
MGCHLSDQAPRQATIILREQASSERTDGCDDIVVKPPLRNLGKSLPTDWPDATLLRLFVRAEEPSVPLRDRLLQQYIIAMGDNLAIHARRLTHAIEPSKEKQKRGYGGYLKAVDQVEIYFPHFIEVLAAMIKQQRSAIEKLVGDGNLILREYDEEVLEGLGLMDPESDLSYPDSDLSDTDW